LGDSLEHVLPNGTQRQETFEIDADTLSVGINRLGK
jgi:hypothetical protein